MSYHSGGYRELALPVERETPGAYVSLKSDLVIFWLALTSRMIVRRCSSLRVGVRPGRGRLSNDWCSHARKNIQRLALTCASKEALNSCPWPAGNLSNKSNIPEAVEKSDDHAFFNIGHFRYGGFWGSLFCF